MFEFLLEVIVAHEMAHREPEHSKAWKANFLERCETPVLGSKASITEAGQSEEWIAERSSQMAKHFMQKVADRETGIREVHRVFGR